MVMECHLDLYVISVEAEVELILSTVDVASKAWLSTDHQVADSRDEP
jgi:hypothetical protein